MTYRPLGAFRFLVVAVFAVFAVVAVVLVAITVGGTRNPPLAFVVFWLAALGWNAYWWLWRMCVEVEVLPQTRSLRWASTLRRGVLPLDDLQRVRPSRFGRQAAIVEVRDRRSLFIPVRFGFERLAQAIKTSAPAVIFDE